MGDRRSGLDPGDAGGGLVLALHPASNRVNRVVRKAQTGEEGREKGMDYSELRRRIRESGKSQKALAAESGISQWQLCRKLNGETDFTLGEARRIGKALGLDGEGFSRCFYREKES